MKRLRIGDVIEINGRRHVVYAKTVHPHYVIEARIADLVTNHSDMCVSIHTPREVIGTNMHAASYQCLLKSFAASRDAKRSRSERVRDLHRERAHTWSRRSYAIRRLFEGRAVA